MENNYEGIFRKIFEVPADETVAKLSYQSIAEWDSVGHMALIAEIEDSFSVTLDIDDVIDFDSYESGKVILAKYGVVM